MNQPPNELLRIAYRTVCTTPSDIVDHCPTLRKLSSQCQHVTEFGVRYGTSTIALLAGSMDGPLLKRVVSYDIVDMASDRLKKLAPSIFEFRLGSSLEVEIEETDLLFIDSYHTGRHLLKELTRHADRVRKWILLHDTELFGVYGENNKRGLLSGLSVFLGRNPHWSIVEHWTNCNGLTLLGRPYERHQPAAQAHIHSRT